MMCERVLSSGHGRLEPVQGLGKRGQEGCSQSVLFYRETPEPGASLYSSCVDAQTEVTHKSGSHGVGPVANEELLFLLVSIFLQHITLLCFIS